MASVEEIASKQFETWGIETNFKNSAEPGELVVNTYSGKKRGLLVVTTFCNNDIPLLKKRCEWFAHIGFKCDRDFLLVGDSDVSSTDLEEVVNLHRPFFQNIAVRSILDVGPTHWPYNVNRAFRTTYRILTGYYGEKFSWAPYNAWFNFESDVTLLKPDAIKQLEDICRKGGKPFAGHISETRMSDGSIVRHMNGAGVYPCAQMNGQLANYNQNLLLAETLPWDVAGLTSLASIHSMPKNEYIHAFGTTEYVKDQEMLQGKQTLMNGQTSQFIFKLGNQIIHHGCKDGSLIDALIGKAVAPREDPNRNAISNKFIPYEVEKEEVKEVETKTPEPVELTLKDKILKDKADGIPYKQLLKKYKLHPKKMKEICG